MTRRQLAAAFVAGLVFGVGLLLSGMTDASKVQGFLDVGGRWDPSLALVMGGAIAVASPAFAWAARLRAPLLGGTIALPTQRAIDRRLVLGSLVFGVGWGIAGLCPGPALVAAAALHPKAWLFVATMVAGMRLVDGLDARRRLGGARA